MIASVFGVLFDGFAYGMLLFLLSVGLSVTLGMMNFVNLAHCTFAMLGGYVTVTLMNSWAGRSSPPCRSLSSAAAAISVVLERTLFRRLYRASDLDQCLLTIGIVFVSIAAAAYIFGTDAAAGAAAVLSARLASTFGGVSFGVYRLFLIGVALVDHGAARARRSSTRASARRCAPRSTTSAWRAGSASTSTRVFAITFALGSGLAGLGGALAIEIVGLDPSFAFTYLVYVLIVVSVGGLGSIGGSFAAADAARHQRHRRQVLRARASAPSSSIW